MKLSEIIGVIGSFASIEAEVRTIVGHCSGKQAEYRLKNLCATKDFSHLPDELAGQMDKIEIYLGSWKSELLGNYLFSQEEKDAVVSDFFASRADLLPYRESIKLIIMKYVNQLEILLLKQMSIGERVLYGMGRLFNEELESVSAKLDTFFCSNAFSGEASQLQIPDIIAQVSAELPEDYIERKVIPHRVAMMDRIERFLNPEEPISLEKAIKENKRILLLSDAGHGKSTELKYAVCVMNEASLSPFF